ncbi:MAG: DUF1501 domain-containing protein [Myxococcota bacterium]
MTIDRRFFLKSMGLGAGAFVLESMVPRPARAAGSTNRAFVFCYFSGAWDTLLSLDPRDPNVFTEDRIGATKIQLGWDQIPANYPKTILQPSGSNINFGPVMGAISAHYDQICVVRGLNMNTVSHDVGRRYFITGMTPRGTRAAGSSVGTRIVTQQGDLRPLPHLVSRVEAYNEGDPVFATGLAVNGSSDLLTSLQDGRDAPAGAVRTRLDAYRAAHANCDPSALDKNGFLTLIRATQSKARDLVSSGVARHFNFSNTADPEIASLRTRYGITTSATTSGAQAALAFQALKHQVAQCVSIELTNQLDTHDSQWATDQPDNQADGWNALAQLVADLKAEPHPDGGTHIDHTTILCFSEFGRTALLNSRGGRDHSLTGACMLLGAGVPHNKVIGASSDTGMNPRKVNPMTGAPDDSGTELNPNLVIASVMEQAGYDTIRLRSHGVPCLMG